MLEILPWHRRPGDASPGASRARAWPGRPCRRIGADADATCVPSGGRMARLIAYSRISPAGLLWRGPAGEHLAAWADLGAGAPDAFGLPPLRAKFFFDDPFPKFGRMDPLCKVAVAAAQLIQRAGGFDGLDRDSIAQVGATALGCLEVDAQFEATRKAGAPSPALFVYTLPSMFQGEVAIQFKLRGRCALFHGAAFAGSKALAQATQWVERGRAPAVLAIAADAAGPAAAAAGYGPPRTAAEAWLVAAEGEGRKVQQVDVRPETQGSD